MVEEAVVKDVLVAVMLVEPAEARRVHPTSLGKAMRRSARR